MLRIIIVLIASVFTLGLSVSVVKADPSGTCPYEYCEYVAPRNVPVFYSSRPIATPTPVTNTVIIIIDNKPLPSPTPTRGPIHFPQDEDFDPCTYRLYKVANQKGCN